MTRKVILHDSYHHSATGEGPNTAKDVPDLDPDRLLVVEVVRPLAEADIELVVAQTGLHECYLFVGAVGVHMNCGRVTTESSCNYLMLTVILSRRDRYYVNNLVSISFCLN